MTRVGRAVPSGRRDREIDRIFRDSKSDLCESLYPTPDTTEMRTSRGFHVSILPSSLAVVGQTTRFTSDDLRRRRRGRTGCFDRSLVDVPGTGDSMVSYGLSCHCSPSMSFTSPYRGARPLLLSDPGQLQSFQSVRHGFFPGLVMRSSRRRRPASSAALSQRARVVRLDRVRYGPYPTYAPTSEGGGKTNRGKNLSFHTIWKIESRSLWETR